MIKSQRGCRRLHRRRSRPAVFCRSSMPSWDFCEKFRTSEAAHTIPAHSFRCSLLAFVQKTDGTSRGGPRCVGRRFVLADHLPGSGRFSKFLRDLQTRREHTCVEEQLDWPIFVGFHSKNREKRTLMLSLWEEDLNWPIVSPQTSNLPNFCESFKLVANISACSRILIEVFLIGSCQDTKEKVTLMCSLCWTMSWLRGISFAISRLARHRS